MKKSNRILKTVLALVAVCGFALPSLGQSLLGSLPMPYHWDKTDKAWYYDYIYNPQGSGRLLFCYSQINNKYEDDNIRAELIGGGLYVWNKTDRPLYIDNRGSFMYLNENDICFYTGTEVKSGNTTYIEQEVKAIAPKATKVLVRNFTNPFGGKTYSAQSGKLSDLAVDFMGYMESLRSDLANAPDKTSSSMHFEQDEAFFTVKAAINYATDSKLENIHSFMVSSWVSDMILSKVYYDPRNNDQKKSNSVSVRGRRKAILHVFADAPFEYVEDSSPIENARIDFQKGKFSTAFFNMTNLGDALDKDGNGNLDMAERDYPTLIWEGHSGDFETSIYDLILKCKLEEGESLKNAEKFAKNEAKKKVAEQMFKNK